MLCPVGVCLPVAWIVAEKGYLVEFFLVAVCPLLSVCESQSEVAAAYLASRNPSLTKPLFEFLPDPLPLKPPLAEFLE